MSDNTINILRRRLEKWELQHLRSLAAELQERLERAEYEATKAWDSAEFWQQNAMQLQDALLEDGFQIGMNKSGEMAAQKAAQCPCGNERCDGVSFRPLYQRQHQPCPLSVDGHPEVINESTQDLSAAEAKWLSDFADAHRIGLQEKFLLSGQRRFASFLPGGRATRSLRMSSRQQFLQLADFSRWARRLLSRKRPR